MEKEEDEEKYLKEQWNLVPYDFREKHPLTPKLRNREIVETIPFYLNRELERHPVLKDIYKKHLDNWKHQFPIYKFLPKNYPVILKHNELDYIYMVMLHNYGHVLIVC